MTHFRTQLRTQVKAVLDTALAADNANVYINRVDPAEESKLPAVVISTDVDRRRAVTVHNDFEADIELTITIYEKEQTGIDTVLDALCAKVENAIQADTTIDAEIELQSTGIDISDADQLTGQAQLNYVVTLYGVDSAETVI